MYRVCGYQLGKDKLTPSRPFNTFTEALTFQDEMHRMFRGLQLITHVETFHRDHIPSGWSQVSNTIRG